MNRNLVLTCLVVVVGISLLIAGSGSELINSALAQETMDNATTMDQGNMTAGAGNMTDSNVTGSGNISGVNDPF
ncbi:MAG: hypothetical protein WCC79_04965 [Nitrososphaeraceae archaeon]